MDLAVRTEYLRSDSMTTVCIPMQSFLAARQLEAQRWVEREPWEPNDGDFSRIMWVSPTRHQDVFRGLGAVSHR